MKPEGGAPSIDSFAWVWDESETTAYFENRLQLWKYSVGPGWLMLNNTPDTVNNRMSLAGEYLSSKYGVLENKTNNAPAVTGVVLNATDNPLNRTNANLTSWLSGISDADSDKVRPFYNWYLNGTSITVLNLLMSQDADDTADKQTIIDISGFNNNATLGSSAQGDAAEPSFNKKGVYNNFGAYEFDGNDDYMEVLNSNSLKPQTVSLTAWVNLNNDGTRHIILAKWSGYTLEVDPAGAPYFQIYNGTAQAGATSSATISWGDWHYIVGTYNPSTNNVSIYVDGQIKGSAIVPGPIVYDNNNLRISHTGYPEGAVNGIISDVVIYNLTLAPEQVKADYDAGIGGKNLTVRQHTRKQDTWNVSVTLVDERGKKGDKVHSNKVLIMTTPPTNSTLQKPNNGNNTLMTRFPMLNWTNVTDDDKDFGSFRINRTHETCGSIDDTGVTSLNKTPDVELHTYDPREACTGWYNWTVEGYDGEDYSLLSSRWGFKVMPIIILSLENPVVDFGNMIPGESDNTTDNDPLPFLVENLGTVVSDIVNSTADSNLWIREPAPTAYFQLQVSDNETGSINQSGSATDWTNIGLANITIINSLNYSTVNNKAKIDI
ncbi:LamG domain-containing protein, partial [archaeon]|nr:LamG domain-containing protein [archaeon]